MGNRACVVFETNDKGGLTRSPAIYLHWNGGPESVYAFLNALGRYRCGVRDVAYAAARFTQIAGTFMGGTTSLGIENAPDDLTELYPGDNGVYVVSPGKEPYEYTVRRFVGKGWFTAAEAEHERAMIAEHPYHTAAEPIDVHIDNFCRARFVEGNEAMRAEVPRLGSHSATERGV